MQPEHHHPGRQPPGEPEEDAPKVRRRTVLAGAGVASLAALAGGGWYVLLRDRGTDGWRGHRGDPANSGVRDDDAGPGDSLSVDWTLQTAELIEAVHDVDPQTFDLPPITDFVSHPVVVADHAVWTQGYQWGDTTREYRVTLVAASVTDGSISWTAELDSVRGGRWFGPVVDSDRVYVPVFVDDDVGMARFDSESGAEADRLDLGLSTSVTQPVVVDDTIYLIENDADGDGRLLAFDATDGTRQWSVSAGVATPGLPALAVANGTIYSFDRAERAMVAHDATEGSEHWREPLDLPPGIHVPGRVGQPAVTNDSVLAAGDYDQFFNRDVGTMVTLDSGTGTEHWKMRPPPSDDGPGDPVQAIVDADEAEIEDVFGDGGFSAAYGQPLLVDGLVVSTGFGEIDGTSGDYLFAVDPSDGSLEWGVELASAPLFPVAAGSTIYAPTSEGVAAVSTDGTHRDTLALDDVSVLTWTSPAVGRGRLFLPERNGIVAVESDSN